MLWGCLTCSAQSVTDVMLLKDPISGKWGYANKVQNRKSPFRGAKKFGRVILGKNMGSALIGKSEADEIDWVIPPQYDSASKEFSEQLAAVEVNGKVGYIDIHNRFIIDPTFESRDNLEGFRLGLSAVKIDGKYGFIDKAGNIVIDATFDYAENFKDNMLATVKKDGKFGAIDITGTLVVPCKFPLEAAMISTPIINKDYREAAKTVKVKKDNLEFHDITEKLDSNAIITGRLINDSLWIQPLTVSPYGKNIHPGLRDQYGRIIVPQGFLSIEPDSIHHIYIVCDTTGLYGLYHYEGSRIFRPLFDSMTAFDEDHVSEVTVAELTGWIGPEGNIDPDFLDNICNKGLLYDQAGQTSQASLLYNRILKIDPNHVMALNNLAIIDIDNKDYNKGMRKLKLAHKLAPDNELIDQNLHQAKKNRNERRWNRVTTGLEIAAALIGAASATYTVLNGSQGMTAGSISTSTSSATNSSGKSSQNIKIDCTSCKGTGICKWCGGSGKDKNTKSGNCPSCHGNTKCKLCHGRGRV